MGGRVNEKEKGEVEKEKAEELYSPAREGNEERSCRERVTERFTGMLNVKGEVRISC